MSISKWSAKGRFLSQKSTVHLSSRNLSFFGGQDSIRVPFNRFKTICFSFIFDHLTFCALYLYPYMSLPTNTFNSCYLELMSLTSFRVTFFAKNHIMVGQTYDLREKNKKYTTPLPYSWDVG